ncbi:MAG: class I SAM-dependent methyltransferase [Ignavibacteria bacterium]|nr:class I SAM-dependent methyltransferase [Ignavibacteria bacterium]
MANPEFYKLAEAYDIAFSDRNFEDECNYYEWCYNNIGKPRKRVKTRSFMELACGPANHSRVFARRGWKTSALDLSEAMLEYAADKDSALNVKTKYFCMDMVRFQTGEKYDLMVTPLESISHILTNDDIITHLNHAADHLHEGGVYIIESTHPRFFFPDDEPNSWSIKHGNKRIEVLFGNPDDAYNTVTHVWDVSTGIKVFEKGKLVTNVETISKHRWYLNQEMLLFIQLVNRFSDCKIFGNYRIPPDPIDDTENCDSLIVVLRK